MISPVFNLNQLLDMLTYARPMNSMTERAFCRRFIAPLPDAYVDTCGNWHVKIGDDPNVLWSCHTDTVHRLAGRQTLHYDARTGIVQLSKRSKAVHSCLGADDTAGVAILTQMVAAGIPGHYLFHYGEERGGVGSEWIAKYHAKWLETFDMAIALDRKGYGDVITHQYGRCCSDAFARSLASQLNAHGLHYAPSDRGVFTDTANYTDMIGECTNLSIGYENAHHDTETLDTRHVAKLFTALCQIDPSALTCTRAAGEIDPDYGWTWIGKGDYHTWPPVDPVWTCDRECVFCSQDYDWMTSTAVEVDEFCSADCERGYYACFLDKSTACAQAATLAQLNRKVN